MVAAQCANFRLWWWHTQILLLPFWTEGKLDTTVTHYHLLGTKGYYKMDGLSCLRASWLVG